MFHQALEILEKKYGSGNPQIAPTVINYGILYLDIQDYQKAESFFQRTLELLKKLPPNDYDSSIVLSNLGLAYLGEGKYAEAKTVLERSLALREKLFGTEHARVAMCLRDLADVHRAQGDYSKAEALYLRALKIFEKVYGPDYPDLVSALQGLAVVSAANGNITKTVSYQARANDITERNILYNLVLGSERQKLAYLERLSDTVDLTLSLHIQLAPDNFEARKLAATMLIHHKGRVLDWMTDNLAVLRQRAGPEDRALIQQLNETTSQLANLVLNGPQKMSLAEHQQKIQTLEEKTEKFETEISHRSAGFYQRRNPVDVSKIQAAIPLDTALLEFGIYRPFDPKIADDKKAFGASRYVVYIFRRGKIDWKDLGQTKAIDVLVAAFRNALRDPKRGDVSHAARAIDEKILKPIRPLLGKATQLFISPDGELNLIPFQALLDEQNHYLIERYACTYLTSGRDLLRLQIARNSKTAPVIVADPVFGEPPSLAQASLKMRTALKGRRSITTGAELADVYFAPLGGTAQEAHTIKSLFADSNLLTGMQATESSLKKVVAPKILHIATHGFFLTDANAHSENPLLRSGIALSGANLHQRKQDDGILTALEASGLNLWGTKLVTLSACDTGIGEIKNGEGVYGLRRALLLAGTETLVMSLWPVSDYITREMMVDYYKRLKNGLGRGEALRQVQLAMLKRKKYEHPFYWASFIQSGEWGTLDVKP
jgi:CHAT domain-containing protein